MFGDTYMKHTELIIARGHRLIQATHKTTFEITKERRLTKQGDCIIAVAADKGMVDFCGEFKDTANRKNSKITVTIEADGIKETVEARGDPALSFGHPNDIVIRKSNYICDRTFAVKAEK